MLEKLDKIWVDGELVEWDDANVHVLTHTLHYGLGAFEGIRSYKQAAGNSAIFRLGEHITRLFESSHLIGLDIPFTRERIAKACLETMQANGLEEGYLRPLVFMGDGAMGLAARSNPTRVVVAGWKWGAYLGDDGIQNGIRARISSWTRYSPNSIYAKGKICGHYVNSMIAKRDALRDGYDEAIMLDTDGFIAEGTGENIFMVSDGVITTPPLSASILAGITRQTIIQLAKERGYTIREERFPRDLLLLADEVFLTGTAAEVTPVREIDGLPIGTGTRGPVTAELQAAYFGHVKGELHDHPEWLSPYSLTEPIGDPFPYAS